MDFLRLKQDVPSSPAFILAKQQVEASLQALAHLRELSGCRILYSIKSLPLATVLQWATATVDGFSVSSLFEARLADEITAGGGSLHITTPGLRVQEIAEISARCSHISFNSISQAQRLLPEVGDGCSPGLRINPKFSCAADARYDPCRSHSKLGASLEDITASPLLRHIEGLHFHNAFASRSFQPLLGTVRRLREVLQDRLHGLQWLNLGGGYMFDQIADIAPFVELVRQLRETYGLTVYIEPGNAVVGRAGYLLATVIDRFESDGKTIAVLDVSVNHHPEVFEYQLRPALQEESPGGAHSAILAGSTCLAGDVFGEYRFDAPVAVGQRLVFEHVGAYSLVKAHRFNGYNLPDVYACDAGRMELLQHYSYRQYRAQWLSDGAG